MAPSWLRFSGKGGSRKKLLDNGAQQAMNMHGVFPRSLTKRSKSKCLPYDEDDGGRTQQARTERDTEGNALL